MTYDGLLEKAQGRERERQKDDARRMRKLEQNFCEMLTNSSFIQSNTSWEEVREKLSDHPAFKVNLPFLSCILTSMSVGFWLISLFSSLSWLDSK